MAKIKLQLGEQEITMNVTNAGEVQGVDSNSTYEIIESTSSFIHLKLNGETHKIVIQKFSKEDQEVILSVNGKRIPFTYKKETDLLLERLGLDKMVKKGLKNLKAPMPGRIISIHKEVGDAVEKGDILLILEAMKMENAIEATGSGIVSEILISAEQAVEKGEELIKFKA